MKSEYYNDPDTQMKLKDMNRKDRRKWLKEHGMLGKPKSINFAVDSFNGDMEFNAKNASISIQEM